MASNLNREDGGDGGAGAGVQFGAERSVDWERKLDVQEISIRFSEQSTYLDNGLALEWCKQQFTKDEIQPLITDHAAELSALLVDVVYVSHETFTRICSLARQLAQRHRLPQAMVGITQSMNSVTAAMGMLVSNKTAAEETNHLAATIWHQNSLSDDITTEHQKRMNAAWEVMSRIFHVRAENVVPTNMFVYSTPSHVAKILDRYGDDMTCIDKIRHTVAWLIWNHVRQPYGIQTQSPSDPVLSRTEIQKTENGKRPREDDEEQPRPSSNSVEPTVPEGEQRQDPSGPSVD
jgi:hypothetical protein